MCAAHFAGFKVPILFVYWNVPSHHYQDMIISFCALTYAILFAGAAMIRDAMPIALVALAATVLGLSAVNLSADLRKQINGGSTARSEEHTSELQSLMRISYAVFCLKKNITVTIPITQCKSHQNK